MAPGKESTFVLDFVNDREGILASFQDYYETTTRITLKPDSTDPTYQPLVFEDLADDELRIVAELVEVLR